MAGELRAQQDQYDVDVSVLRLSFVRGDYTPGVSSHAGANVDPDLETMMAWLRNHSPTSVKTVADSVQNVIEAENASPLTNVGIDGNTSSYALLVERVGGVIPLGASVPTSTQEIFNRILEKLEQDAEDLVFQNEQLADYKTRTEQPALVSDIEALVAKNETTIRKIQALMRNKSNLDTIASIL